MNAIRRLVLLGVNVLVLAAPRHAAEAFGQSEDPQDMIRRMQNGLAQLGEQLGGLSADEQKKLDAMEEQLIAKVKADPTMTDRKLSDLAMARFRGVLTPAHRPKFDEILAKSQRYGNMIKSSEQLEKLGAALLAYAKAHDGTLPPTLGALAGKVSSAYFLAFGSKTKVPADFASLEAASRTSWIDQHTDYLLLGGGKKLPASPDQVVVYMKPALGQDQNIFLCSDGSVHQYGGEIQEQIITELTAGQNPPPTLVAKVHAPTTQP